MKNFQIVILLILGIFIIDVALTGKCSKNCYMGESLFSGPMSKDGCCLEALDKNCFSYAQLTTSEFVCRQCKLGFKWDNARCVAYPEDEICINPDFAAFIKNPCKVCRIKDKLLMPVIDAIDSKKTVNEAVPTCKEVPKGHEYEKRLQNCLASALQNGVILCHLCKENMYYDAIKEQCVCAKTEKSKLYGCMISFFPDKCAICKTGFQLDMRSVRCTSKNVEIDYISYQKELLLKFEKNFQMEQEAMKDPNTANLMASINSQMSNMEQNQVQYNTANQRQVQPNYTQNYNQGYNQNNNQISNYQAMPSVNQVNGYQQSQRVLSNTMGYPNFY